MARSKSNSSLTFIPLALVVVAGSLLAGYYLGGGTHEQIFTSQNPAPQPSPLPVAVPGTDHTVKSTLPHNEKTDYTAPNAPDIQITELKQPVLAGSESGSKIIKADGTSSKAPDSEASQQGDQADGSPAAPPNTTATTDIAPETSAAPPDDHAPSNDQTAITTAPDNSNGDYEKIIPPSAAGSDQAVTPSTAALRPVKNAFRVQTGSFVVARNARILADALHDRGYDTSLRVDKEGDQTVYRVQTGAYRTKTAANRAADELRASGYPAYVSPITQD